MNQGPKDGHEGRNCRKNKVFKILTFKLKVFLPEMNQLWAKLELKLVAQVFLWYCDISQTILAMEYLIVLLDI